MHIVIAGPGALGCFLAARLSAVLPPDADLILLDHRKERARQLNQTGFILEQNGKSDHYPVQVTADTGQIPCCDLFLLCTRTGDVDAALAQAESLLSLTTMCIGFQRGIKLLQLQYPVTAIVPAISSSYIFQDNHGHIICNDPGRIVIGHLENSAAEKYPLEPVIKLFNAADLHTETNRDIRTQVWGEFLQDLAINVLAAIYRRPYGRLLTSCSVRGNLKKILREALAVARAHGISIAADPIKQAFHTLRTDKEKIAPMLRDIQNRRATEIDGLNGALVKLGRELSIATPINDDFVQRIKTLEAGYHAS